MITCWTGIPWEFPTKAGDGGGCAPSAAPISHSTKKPGADAAGSSRGAYFLNNARKKNSSFVAGLTSRSAIFFYKKKRG